MIKNQNNISSQKRKIYMKYRPDDFILYTFSLVVFAAISVFALQSYWQNMMIFAALIFMLVYFIYKNGVKIDLSSFSLIIKESAYYPVYFLKQLIPSLWALFPIYAGYGLARAFEFLFASRLSETYLFHPFPYMNLFYFQFLSLTLYRTVILIAHIRHSDFLHDFLMSSLWKHQMKDVRPRYYIIHAYITGILGHVAFFFPCLIFWRLTSPTYFREIACTVLTMLLFLLTSVCAGNGVNIFKILVEDVRSWFLKEHENYHTSRFYFTIFHGLHHDAIPSSLMANNSSGIMHAIHAPLVKLFFLLSATVFSIITALDIMINMRGHQYIPGIFPYSRSTISNKSHHAIHHYMSILPLSFGGAESQKDVDMGYDFSNIKARWYVSAVARYENIEPELIANYLRHPDPDPAQTHQVKPS